METTKYIALDVETGGIESDTTLLTAYFGVYDENLELLDDLYLRMHPDAPKGKRPKYVLTAEGMDVNGIDLVAHDAFAIPMKTAGQELYSFLAKNSNNGATKLVPLGHNVYFDILGVTERGLVSKNSWEKHCSYRVVDTATIGRFLIEAGVLPRFEKGSLGQYCEHFHIPTKGQHDAKVDVDMTVRVYKNFLELVKE